MAAEDFNFAYDFEGLDRSALLHEAVAQLNALEGGAKGGLESQEVGAGALAAGLLQEQASLPVFPDVYHISDQDYLARNLAAPVKFTQLSKDFDFYWLRFQIGLLPNHNWTFNRLEVRVEFNPDGAVPHLRPRAYEILPNKKFQTLVEADQHLKLGFDENFELAAKTGVVGGQLGDAAAHLNVGVEGVADGGFGLVLGPFEYRVKRARIDHNSTGLEWVFWRFDGVEYSQEDTPDLVVIAQVPKETKAVAVQARLQAYHNFNFAAATLQSAVANLPKVLREYFRGGAPLQDEKLWDLTPRLAN